MKKNNSAHRPPERQWPPRTRHRGRPASLPTWCPSSIVLLFPASTIRFFFFLNEIINCKSTDKLTLFLSFTPAPLPFNQVLAPKDTHGPPHHKPTTTTNKRLNALVKVCAKEKRVNVNVLTALPVRVAVDPRAPTIAVGTVSANHWRNLPVITHLSKPTSVWLV